MKFKNSKIIALLLATALVLSSCAILDNFRIDESENQNNEVAENNDDKLVVEDVNDSTDDTALDEAVTETTEPADEAEDATDNTDETNTEESTTDENSTSETEDTSDDAATNEDNDSENEDTETQEATVNENNDNNQKDDSDVETVEAETGDQTYVDESQKDDSGKSSKKANNDNLKEGTAIELDTPFVAYGTAYDAEHSQNPITTYNPGTYYVFTTSNGMINITKNPGFPGGWINPQGLQF